MHAVVKRERGSWSSRPGEGEGLKLVLSLVGHAGDECVTWPYGTCNGYGVFSAYGENHYAHRYICELVNGPPPTPEHESAHSCGNGHKGCINPNHLLWKTTGENQLDRAIHGTKNVWGGRGKLTADEAQQIRELAGKIPQREIAKRFGVSRSTISWVVTGKAWTKPCKGYQKWGNRWRARVKVKGNDIILGIFDTEEEAHRAYLAGNTVVRELMRKGISF